MKTISKKFAVLAVVGLGLAFIGCAQDADKAVMVDAQGKPQGAGVTPQGASRTSADFADKNKGPMQGAKMEEYKKAQGK